MVTADQLANGHYWQVTSRHLSSSSRVAAVLLHLLLLS